MTIQVVSLSTFLSPDSSQYGALQSSSAVTICFQNIGRESAHFCIQSDDHSKQHLFLEK